MFSSNLNNFSSNLSNLEKMKKTSPQKTKKYKKYNNSIIFKNIKKIVKKNPTKNGQKISEKR